MVFFKVHLALIAMFEEKIMLDRNIPVLAQSQLFKCSRTQGLVFLNKVPPQCCRHSWMQIHTGVKLTVKVEHNFLGA